MVFAFYSLSLLTAFALMSALLESCDCLSCTSVSAEAISEWNDVSYENNIKISSSETYILHWGQPSPFSNFRVSSLAWYC